MDVGSLAGGQFADADHLAHALGPALQEQLHPRLGAIEWFRSTWQRGGAATGYSTWTDADERTIDVVVKFPVSWPEFRWTKQLGTCPEGSWQECETEMMPTPRVAAAGHELGSYDFAWFVVERFRGHPLSSDLSGDGLRGLIEAAVEFQARASALAPVDATPPGKDWARLIERAQSKLDESGIEEAKRWKSALKRVVKALPTLEAAWARRACRDWCHGDMHPGNAMRRLGGDGEPLRWVLIDLGLVHAGHWVEDAVYLERLFWGHEDRLEGVDPVRDMAAARRAAGLDSNGDHLTIADVRRVLMAACVPAFLEGEGWPSYVSAALDRLETLLPSLVGRLDRVGPTVAR